MNESLGYVQEKDEEYKSLKYKAASGVFLLGVRRVAIQFIQTASSIILARLLFPEVFGAFAIALFIVSFFTVFTDIGFGTALIQQKGVIEKKQIQTLFTTQITLSVLVTVLLYILAPYISLLYQAQLGPNGTLYLRQLSLIIVLLAARNLPATLLERDIRYGKFVIGEIGEILLTQVVTVGFVLLGQKGVESFIWGTLAGKGIGTILFMFLAKWEFGFSFSLRELQKILPFGIPFQTSQIVGQLNAAIIPILVGFLAGSAGVGFVNWAGGVAALPRVMLEIVSRVIFPVAARLQDSKKQLGNALERTLQLTNLSSFPIIVLVFVLAPEITYIVFTDKWLLGVSALYLFSIQSIFVLIGSIVSNTLLALGEAKFIRNVQVAQTILLWILSVPLIKAFGFTGYALASLTVSVIFFWLPLKALRSHLPFQVWSHTWQYLVYSGVMGGMVFVLARIWVVHTVWQLLFIIGVGMLFYLLLLWWRKRYEIQEDVRRIRRLVLAGTFHIHKPAGTVNE